MFRPPLRLTARALLTSSSAAVVGVILHDPPQDREKLSIYSAPTPEILLLETPSPLEKQIGVVRRTATQAYCDAHAHVQGVVSKWIGIEHAVENRVKAIVSPTEPLTPGLLYVGISTLSGSILARNRFFPTRLILPPTLFFISLSHFLPKTSANLSSYLSSLEETYFPNFAEKHNIANAHSRMTWERMKAATEGGRESLNRGVESAVAKVQGVTGLKLKEAFGWSESIAKQVEGTALDIKKVVEKKAGEVEVVVDQKVGEAKEAADKKVEEAKRLV